MSGIPLLVEASALRVLVVGAGVVATRKVQQFSDAGAMVRIVASGMSVDMEALTKERGLHVECRPYASGDIGDAHLVIAATNDRTVNALVASDARDANRLVNRTDVSEDGTFVTMATHREGSLTIGVGAGGVPGAAARIRDAIAGRFDTRYAEALGELKALRARLLAGDGATLWRARSDELVGAKFCELVEQGGLSERIASWP